MCVVKNKSEQWKCERQWRLGKNLYSRFTTIKLIFLNAAALLLEHCGHDRHLSSDMVKSDILKPQGMNSLYYFNALEYILTFSSHRLN